MAIFVVDAISVFGFAGFMHTIRKPLLYADAVPFLRNGDILLYRAGWKPSNLLIARVGGTPYCHAGMIFRDFVGRPFLAETIQWIGGRAVLLSGQVEAYPGRWDVYRLRQPYDGDKAAEEMLRVIGQPYGWGSLASCALRHTRFISRFLPPLTDDKLNGSAPFCSQAVSRACRAGGRDPLLNCADKATEPGHLANPDFAKYLFTLDWDQATR